MTFDNIDSTDVGTALAEIRDKITGVTGWSLAYTAGTGADASVDPSNYTITIETPTGEYIELTDDPYAGTAVGISYGPDYDTTNGGFNDAYPEPSNDRFQFTSGTATATDLADYMIEYVPRGFVFHLRRNENDGEDDACLIGFCEVSKLWNYDNAATREGDYAYRLSAGNSPGDYSAGLGVSGESNRHEAEGRVNQDSNFTSFEYVEDQVLAASTYNGTIVGTVDLWISDNSGSDLADGDTVQDSGGTDVYTVAKEHLSTPTGIRMD